MSIFDWVVHARCASGLQYGKMVVGWLIVQGISIATLSNQLFKLFIRK